MCGEEWGLALSICRPRSWGISQRGDGDVVVELERALLPVKSARDIVIQKYLGDRQGEVPPSGAGTARSLTRT
jgi:hypothetical protein